MVVESFTRLTDIINRNVRDINDEIGNNYSDKPSKEANSITVWRLIVWLAGRITMKPRIQLISRDSGPRIIRRFEKADGDPLAEFRWLPFEGRTVTVRQTNANRDRRRGLVSSLFDVLVKEWRLRRNTGLFSAARIYNPAQSYHESAASVPIGETRH
jgi:hypothetical protein